MASRTLYDAYDRLLGGKLGAELVRLADDGNSLREIGFLLRTEHDVIISTETLRRWLVRARSELAKAAS